jgi:hypothetical protein
MFRVYVSSTFSDLEVQRRAATDAISGVRHYPIGMEGYAASDERPLDRCLQDVLSCDVYVGIVAWKYGFRPDGVEKSITQLEYEAAARIPRLIFLLADDAAWPRMHIPDEDQVRIKEFRQMLRREHTVATFRDAAGLAYAVTQSLAGVGHSGIDTPFIPNILPYLCDRSKQEDDLRGVLELSETRRDRPIVCIVHGGETEAHDALLERLQLVMLPQLLPDQGAGVHSYQLEWPSSSRTPQEMRRMLVSSLSKQVLENARGTCEMINLSIGANPGPVVVHSHVLTEDLENEPARTRDLDAFIRLWEEWPDLAVGQKLFVFLFVKYQDNKGFGESKRRRYRHINDEIRYALGVYDFSGFVRLTAAVLAELEGPTLTETQAWARSAEVGKFCDRQQLLKATDDFYAQWGREKRIKGQIRIPTDELAPRLIEMMSRTQQLRRIR